MTDVVSAKTKLTLDSSFNKLQEPHDEVHERSAKVSPTHKQSESEGKPTPTDSEDKTAMLNEPIEPASTP